jgi:hypothetical protein
MGSLPAEKVCPRGSFFKARDKLTTASVDFDRSGDLYRVEWWQCGSKNPNWDLGEFPLHYVLVRPPKDQPLALAVTLSNCGRSDGYFYRPTLPSRFAPASLHNWQTLWSQSRCDLNVLTISSSARPHSSSLLQTTRAPGPRKVPIAQSG